MSIGNLAPAGRVGLTVIRQPQTAVPAEEMGLRDLLRFADPDRRLGAPVNRYRRANACHIWRGLRRIAAARALNLPHFFGRLSLVHIARDGSWVDLGLVSLRVVTDAGVNFLVDALQNLVEPELLKFHGIGTGIVAEAVGDTALGTELTTQYDPDNTRATGTLTEGASANIYRTVGTNTVDAAVAITEHGILTQAATGGGTLLDRSVFAAVNLASGDSLQSTYDLTLSSGG